MAVEFVEQQKDSENRFAIRHIESGKFIGDIWFIDDVWFSTARYSIPEYIFTASDHLDIADKLEELQREAER